MAVVCLIAGVAVQHVITEAAAGRRMDTAKSQSNSDSGNGGGRRSSRGGNGDGQSATAAAAAAAAAAAGWLVPPALHNSSCTHPRYSGPSAPYPSAWNVLQAAFVLLLSAGILAANLLVIFVINTRRYAKYIHAQVNLSILLFTQWN